MPVPSACSKNIFTAFKFFWACSIFFEHSQIFWSWSKARFYLINLHIWAWSKIFEHIQKILNTVKNIWTWSKNIWTSRWIRHVFKKYWTRSKKFEHSKNIFWTGRWNRHMLYVIWCNLSKVFWMHQSETTKKKEGFCI